MSEIYFSVKTVKKVLTVLLIVWAFLGVFSGSSHKSAAINREPEKSAGDYYGEDYTESVGLVGSNTEALLCRVALIENAKEEIIYSTMDFRTDESGTDILACLNAAAERGVRVRLVVDGFNSAKLLRSRNLKALASNPNVTVYSYNPFNFFRPDRVTMRLHDKYIIADGTAYMLGGRNTNDLFLGEYGDGRRNHDRELLVVSTTGEGSIRQLGDYFEAVAALPQTKTLEKRDASKYEKELKSLRERHDRLLEDLSDGLKNGSIELYPAGRISLMTNSPEPRRKDAKLWKELVCLMKSGDEVVIQSPYVICGQQMRNDLAGVCGTADVSLVTNSVKTGANPWGCAEWLNMRRTYINMGMRLYETEDSRSTHTKTVLIDGRMSVVGSFNFDMRSCYLDTELMLAVDCPELNERLRREARTSMERSVITASGQVSYGAQYEEYTLPVPKRVLYGVLRVVILPFRFLL